jgi:uncharacterized 2Fe-2S/4Fe-4S cluster protein (DUF4445 family)
MNYQIRVHRGAQTDAYQAPQDANLLRFLQQKNYKMDTPCNGRGSCGKCRVKFGGPVTPEPAPGTEEILGAHAIAQGFRLACQTTIDNDLELYLDGTDFQAKILTDGQKRSFPLATAIVKKLLTLPPPTLADQRSDSERLAEFLPSRQAPDRLSLLRELPALLRKDNLRATAIFNCQQLTGLEAGDTTARLYGIAVDIGTTTIAAYLLNMLTGEKIATYSCLNPQRKFGADVISRISHTTKHPDGLEEMHRTVIDALNLAAENLAESAGLKSGDLYQMVCVGNTTMLHFLLNISAQNIAAAPFIPVTTQGLTVTAAEIGLRLNKNAIVTVVPAVAAYIGADTVAAVLASGIDRGKPVSLLVDLGTNGEIVLGNNQWMLACSAAAGPAFEGANIRDGIGGIRGAIDSYSIAKDTPFTTIDAAPPIGICGSGLIDIASELYQAGIISGTGRLESDRAGLETDDSGLHNRLTSIDGMAAFIVAQAHETGHGHEITITQKDIRELQSAKAAIAAGINVLVNKAGICLSDIAKVYLAGGFGAYINIENALNIGLIPPGLRGKIESIGNAAGTGAVTILGSRHALRRANLIKKKIRYIELSSCPEFNDFFIDAMIFEE